LNLGQVKVQRAFVLGLQGLADPGWVHAATVDYKVLALLLLRLARLGREAHQVAVQESEMADRVGNQAAKKAMG
jgi:hypothetical protein